MLQELGLSGDAMAREFERSTNLWDALFGALGRAARDVREKVVEEPWFGRPLSRGATPGQRSVAEELGWVRGDNAPSPVSPAKDQAHELDR
jgi:hypothetical protein